MSLLHRVRVLVGALIHEPFAPRPEKIDLGEGSSAGQAPIRQGSPDLEAPAARVEDTERVADLIARRKQDGAG
jgi:hypothetical protein